MCIAQMMVKIVFLLCRHQFFDVLCLVHVFTLVYEGEYLDGPVKMRHGHGVMKYANGDIYEGFRRYSTSSWCQ